MYVFISVCGFYVNVYIYVYVLCVCVCVYGIKTSTMQHYQHLKNTKDKKNSSLQTPLPATMLLPITLSLCLYTLDSQDDMRVRWHRPASGAKGATGHRIRVNQGYQQGKGQPWRNKGQEGRW